ncbi:uncharacterized protein LOC131841641 [Achroia grisella]|uniref:uncharacterized protein LOC131841641 n=1 Tax=Achroia grisella TaxID=688607 RepID=UPI0027D29E59|nr:uncharacterized protein LOC131841641 [Achroia grisella]
MMGCRGRCSSMQRCIYIGCRGTTMLDCVVYPQDRRRVQSRFAGAGGAGLDVRERRGGLAPHELAAQLRRGPLILLIDASLLSCDLCYYNKFRLDFRWCLGGRRYRGHYVVLCGLRGTRAYYCDPARGGREVGGGGRGEGGGLRGGRGRVCAAPLERVLRAHRAVGTDHDAILIYKDYTRP